MLRVKAIRGAKGMDWRESLAFSPLAFAGEKQNLQQISKYTGINRLTLLSLLNRRLTEWTVPSNGVPHLLTVTDLDTGNPTLKRNTDYPVDRMFRFGADGLPTYFWLGVPRRSCPLSPAENYLYWWLRQQIESGKSNMSAKEAARLSTLPKSTVVRGVRRLVELGWLVVEGDGFRVGDVEIDHYYQQEGGRRQTEDTRTLAELVADVKPKPKPKPKQKPAPTAPVPTAPVPTAPAPTAPAPTAPVPTAPVYTAVVSMVDLGEDGEDGEDFIAEFHRIAKRIQPDETDASVPPPTPPTTTATPQQEEMIDDDDLEDAIHGLRLIDLLELN